MKLLDFNIADLYMLTLLRDGLTVTQCAKAMHLTQPAVSQRMKKFTLLAICLHERDGRSVKLNEAGLKLAEASAEALAILAKAI